MSIFDAITSIPPPFNMVVYVVLIVTTASLAGTIAKQLRKYTSHRHELEFKRELVERGLSVDEIERVVRARGPAVEAET